MEVLLEFLSTWEDNLFLTMYFFLYYSLQSVVVIHSRRKVFLKIILSVFKYHINATHYKKNLILDTD